MRALPKIGAFPRAGNSLAGQRPLASRAGAVIAACRHPGRHQFNPDPHFLIANGRVRPHGRREISNELADHIAAEVGLLGPRAVMQRTGGRLVLDRLDGRPCPLHCPIGKAAAVLTDGSLNKRPHHAAATPQMGYGACLKSGSRTSSCGTYSSLSSTRITR